MKGTIYRLQCATTGNFYIGSTIHTLAYRLKKHRSTSKELNKMNSRLYTHFRTVGWENAIMTVVREVEFQTRCELLIFEREEIDKYIHDELCLNCNRPKITRDEKKQHDQIYGKKRRDKNKEVDRLRVAEWRKNNPEKYAEQVHRSVEKQRIKRISATTTQ